MKVKIRTCKYIDTTDLPKEAEAIYAKFVGECGLANGEHWSYEIGNDHVIGSYVGENKAKILDEAVKLSGLKDGDIIDLVLDW